MMTSSYLILNDYVIIFVIGMAALELYQTYLMNGAELEINLEPSLRYEVLDRIDQGHPVDEVSLFGCTKLCSHS